MVADGVDALAWLTWSSPHGVLSRAQPFAGDRPLPLAILAAMSAAAAVAALAVARRRDAEAGLWSPSPTRAPRLAWMRSPFRFALHRVLRTLMLWAAGLAAYFGLVGSLATSMTRFLTENPRFAEMASRAGVTDIGAVEGYAAALLGLLALPIGAFAAGMIAGDAEDESSRRFAMLFALPMSRARWAASHAAVAVLACLALAIAAGVAIWAGSAATGSGLTLWSSLAGALNAVPVALVCLGAALLALGWTPRAVFAIGSLPAVGGFLLLVLADTFGWPGWVRAVSPFAHVADVPATPVDTSGTVTLLIVACLLGSAGVLRYAKRDLQG
jgi:ABC-2 type transport system permease protein